MTARQAVAAWMGGLALLTAPSPSRADQTAGDSVLQITKRTRAETSDRWRVSFRDRGAKPSYMERMGVTSVDGVANIDCAVRRFQLEQMVLHVEPRDDGEPPMRIASRPEWRTADSDTLMARVIDAACRSRPEVTLAQSAPTRAVPFPSTNEAPTTPTADSPRQNQVQVQFGAFSTREQALQTWSRISREDSLAPLTPTVEPATVGGKLYHRLLVGGFASRDAARDACKRAAGKGYACFVRG